MKKSLLFFVIAVAMMVLGANAQVTLLSEGFESTTLPAGWTLIDADNDGQCWLHNSNSFMDGYNSAGAYYSSSQGNVSPDNWLVTPAITLGSSSTLSFWRMVSHQRPADHYGVYVSTTSATDPSAFTLLFEETPTAVAYVWTNHTVDLSAYSNSTVYIAFRHFNCSNQFAIILDDVSVTSTMSSDVITASPGTLQFPDVPVGTTSAPQTVTVSTYNITGDVTAMVSSPFEISTDSINYSLGVMLTGGADQDLYVRYAPTVVGNDSAVVTLTGGTAVANVVLLGNSIACAAPTELSVEGVTSTSATLFWSGSANGYHIYYKAASDTGWSVIENVTADTAGYPLGNLTPSTNYTWSVAAVCDDGTIMNSEATGSFTTGCGAFTAPFSQNFDASASLPQCWERYNGWASDVFAGGGLSSTTGGWGFYNTMVFGANHPRLNICNATCNRWLVTPAIDLSALTNPVLTFDLALTTWNGTSAITVGNQPDDKFMVIVSTDDGATWSAANAVVWSNDNTGNFVYDSISTTGQEISISLADYANQTVKIAFYGESTVTNGDNDLHIDNVMVYSATSCTKPTNLSVSAVTGSSVTLAWTENGSATAWNIEYGPAGYAQGSAGATYVQASTNPFTLDNLPVAAYDFYVQADCGGEQSLWVGPVTAAPGSFNTGLSGSDTLTTCALIVYDNGGPNGNYSANCDYTLLLYPEVAGNFIAVSGSYHTENCCDYLRIYDGAGTGNTMLGEFKGTGTVPTLVSSTGPLTFYFHSDSGLQYDGFELNVSCAACASPGNVTFSNVTATSADVTWTGLSTSYLVEYKSEEDTVWNSQTTLDTAFSFSGLTESTVYTVNLYSDCDGTYSPATTATFSTTMASTAIPFSTDFSVESGWVLNNGTCSNYWTIAPVSDSTNALFVTNNGTTPGYSTSSFSVVSAEKLFTVGTAAELEISFDVQVGGETQFDYLKVYFAPASEEYPATNTNIAYANTTYSTYAVNFSDFLTYSSYSSLPYKFNLTGGNTVHVSVVMPNPNSNPNANSTAKLVFLWKNDQTDGSQPGAIVRQVSVEAVSCSAPINLTVSNIGTTSADVTWNAAGSEDEWVLEYQEEGDTAWTSVQVNGTPAYTLLNLSSGTSYDVRVQSVCSADAHSLWVSAAFTTFCDAIATFPFTEGFEHGGAMPDCWMQEHVSGHLNWTFQNGADSHGAIHEAHGGSYNAFCFVESNNGSTTRLITPILDLSGLTDAYVTFWHAQQPWGNDQDQLSVYYRTSTNDSWQQLTQYSNAVAVWTMDSLALPNLSATYQLAFVGFATYGYGIVLDDITIDGTHDTTVVVTDPTVATLAATAIGQTTATLNATITNPDDVTLTAKGFEWKTTDGTYTQVTGTGTGNTFSYTLDNLTASTGYTYRAFITFNGQTVYGDEMTFTTEIDSTSVEAWLAASVKLYPNPANDVVYVQCTMNDVPDGDLQLFDVYGKLQQVVPITGETISINLSGLANGVYFVRITTGQGAVTKTVVKK